MRWGGSAKEPSEPFVIKIGERSSRSLIGWQLTALMVAISVIAWGWIWGRRVERINVDIKLGAPPMVGSLVWHPTGLILPAIAIAAVALFVLHRFRGSFKQYVLISSLFGAIFTFALAASDGISRLLDPVVHRTEYWDNLDVLPSSGRMLEWFSSREFLRYYSVHLKGHPPGFVVLLKGLAAIGLGKPWVTGLLSYVGVALMVMGVLVTTRSVVGEESARRIAPFLVVAPFSMWMGTSADAFFSGIAALSVMLVVLALNQENKRAYAIAFGAGLSLGCLLFLTYAATSFLLLPGLITVIRRDVAWGRRIRLGLVAACGSAAIVLTFLGFGFWWIDGLRNTNWFYWHGTAQFRPWKLFMVVNAGAALVAIGPAVVAGIASMRRTRAWLPVGTAIFCLVLASASQYTKGEVERIWILFYPWLMPAVASLPARRIWVALQATGVIVLQMWLISKW